MHIQALLPASQALLPLSPAFLVGPIKAPVPFHRVCKDTTKYSMEDLARGFLKAPDGWGPMIWRQGGLPEHIPFEDPSRHSLRRTCSHPLGPAGHSTGLWHEVALSPTQPLPCPGLTPRPASAFTPGPLCGRTPGPSTPEDPAQQKVLLWEMRSEALAGRSPTPAPFSGLPLSLVSRCHAPTQVHPLQIKGSSKPASEARQEVASALLCGPQNY